MVRKATKVDLPGIVSVHEKAFNNFFLTRLGRGFLRRYYEMVLSYREGILLVSGGPGGLDGFACGFVDSDKFYALMRKNKWNFVLPILSALVRHPSLVVQIVCRMQHVENQAAHGVARACELSSIAVTPEVSGRGVGMALVNAFLKQAWSLSAQHIYLDTDADDNEPVNVFYQKAGFQFCCRFQKFKGRWMNEYVIHRLPGGERLRVV